MSMDAARGSTPSACASCTSPVVARSRKPPASITVSHRRRVRQRLQRIVQVDTRQSRGSWRKLRADALAVDHQQGEPNSRTSLRDRAQARTDR